MPQRDANAMEPLAVEAAPPKDETLATLMEAGLTGYQARAYMTLVRVGSAKVLPLARASAIPRNKLYHVLEELERVRLVEAVSREPLEYRPLPLANYLEARVKRLTALLEQYTNHPLFR